MVVAGAERPPGLWLLPARCQKGDQCQAVTSRRPVGPPRRILGLQEGITWARPQLAGRSPRNLERVAACVREIMHVMGHGAGQGDGPQAAGAGAQGAGVGGLRGGGTWVRWRWYWVALDWSINPAHLPGLEALLFAV
jgi:hypothetical protein